MVAPTRNPATDSAAARGQPKILRACVVQGGKVIEEQRLRRREPLTVGTGGRNTFVIADGALPRTHQLFAVKAGQYYLVLTEAMRGRVSVDNRPVDFSLLKSQGQLKKQGDFYFLPLTEQHRGKVIIGETTIIFQFVAPPPAPVKPQLPPAARGTLKDRVDWPFAATFLAVVAFEAPVIAYVALAAPEVRAVTLEDIDERWAKLIVPELALEQKVEPEKAKGKGDAGETKNQKKAQKGKSDGVGDAKAKAARTAEIKKAVSGRGMLAVLSTMGEGTGGAVADVFGDGGLGGDLDSAFSGISGVGVAAGSGDRTTRGSGDGEAATIEGLATAGGGQVGLGGKRETRLGSVAAEAPEVDGKLDSDAIAKVVRSRMRMVQDCYERELKRDPSLAGKIEIEFTIDDEGRVVDAVISSNKMGSDAVGECIVSRLRRWRFPKPDGGSVTVNFPFIFTAST